MISDHRSIPLNSRLSPESKNAPILVVEDDPALAQEIRHRLQAAGHPVRVAGSIEEGLGLARLRAASALVIDRMLNGSDGLSIIETLRSEGDLTPVLVISGLSSVDERIEGLTAGGDDYLIKPFDVRELVVRVDALLRRRGETRPTRLITGDLEMDLVERKVRCAGRQVDLLPREFKLLEYFMRRPGQIVTRAKMLEDVWNFKFHAETHVVDVQLGNLRRKLDQVSDRRYIVNVRTVGFKLDVDG
jgi:two-component system, OmpR family, response regulator